MILILLIISLMGFAYYKYLIAKFVHFMNTFILVPPQKLIIESIISLNIIIKQLNKPFNLLHSLKIGHTFEFAHSFGKIFNKELSFSKKLGFSIQPFKKIIPYDLIPEIPNLSYKCIDEPDGYKYFFNFSTPKECKKTNLHKKKRTLQNISSDTFSSRLSYFILVLIIMFLLLIYIANRESIPTEHLNTEFTKLSANSSSIQPSAFSTSLPPISTSLATSLATSLPTSLATSLPTFSTSLATSLPPISTSLATSLPTSLATSLATSLPPISKSLPPISTSLATSLPTSLQPISTAPQFQQILKQPYVNKN